MNMIQSRMERRGQGGFTLIELLVVIAILAVLAGAAIIGIGAMRTNAQKTACRSDRDTIETAAEAYRIDTSTQAATIGVLTGGSDPYLKKVSASDFSLAYDANGNPVASATAGGKYKDVQTPCNA